VHLHGRPVVARLPQSIVDTLDSGGRHLAEGKGPETRAYVPFAFLAIVVQRAGFEAGRFHVQPDIQQVVEGAAAGVGEPACLAGLALEFVQFCHDLGPCLGVDGLT